MKKRDIFFVHTKGSRDERDVVKFATQELHGHGYSVWQYNDWHWADEDRVVESQSRALSMSDDSRLGAGPHLTEQSRVKSIQRHFLGF
jgi:hypothetical protein